jgi:hypothetical protein
MRMKKSAELRESFSGEKKRKNLQIIILLHGLIVIHHTKVIQA